MKIGIVGAGKIGGTLGTLWHGAGHEVRFGNRHPEQVKELVAKLGPPASAGTPEEAARFGVVVLLAVPIAAVPVLADEIGAQLAGKVVLDAGNPYAGRDGALADAAVAHAQGSSGWVAGLFPSARVVKAFNTVYFKTLQERAHQNGDRLGIPIAGDDPQAVELAAGLVRDAGFEPVPTGALAEGRRFEPGASVYNTGMRASELRRALAEQGGR